MGGRGVGGGVRILGLASTTRGFAFAVTEAPDRLADWGLRSTPVSKTATRQRVEVVLRRARPLFVAFEPEAGRRKRHRGRLFGEVVTSVCSAYGIMMLAVESQETRALADVTHPTKWDVADVMAERFPELAPKLPARRKPWQGEDDRIGLFVALATASAAWERFRARR